jgi:succinate dehydrogenase flavin-adding protein (antitoxin of CptAB toxin-antitoxin module)
MTFAESLAEFSAAQIVAALGCPRQTAYAWLDGSRQPPDWQQSLFLAQIRRHTAKRK